MSSEVGRAIREAYMDVYPYLHSPRAVEGIVNELAKLGSLEEAVARLEEEVKEAPDPTTATDLRILLNRLRSRRGG